MEHRNKSARDQLQHFNNRFRIDTLGSFLRSARELPVGTLVVNDSNNIYSTVDHLDVGDLVDHGLLVPAQPILDTALLPLLAIHLSKYPKIEVRGCGGRFFPTLKRAQQTNDSSEGEISFRLVAADRTTFGAHVAIRTERLRQAQPAENMSAVRTVMERMSLQWVDRVGV
jgi:hypothetical protein